MTTSQYPALDDSRHGANAELDRLALEELGLIEPHIDELDSYCSMPIRVTANAAGMHLELGPYDLDASDVARLRAAINAYDNHHYGEYLHRR
ncbi:hypothetical protein [Mycolicibacter hiberniae]|uniref:Uncharacterized protein n=1 Tax=Mycolicibacter hiberniae TaxID=29314 RepID=A0A7I7X945_9MYCO|nr:hypothetical protein [Mycolicibacter hiberniae]MCV7087367.1 hypothetical protein [Mycolicibacter hiberniae]ORV67669.1 hypothetical protein AWC09_15905 [Mycolicibacter hiberniae]BBZ25417.1 hypothetical protein MHIB_38350 [Mycolicibacter hiberniae]